MSSAQLENMSSKALFTQARALGVALVPLALAGLLPLWAVILLCVVFGLGARFVAWGQARFLALVLMLGLTMLGPLREALAQDAATSGAHLTDLLFRYLVLGLAGLLTYFGAEALDDGRRRGLLLVLLSGLLAPQPWLVLALVGGAMSRPGPDDFMTRSRLPAPGEKERARRGWGWVGLAVLGLTLLAAALPQPRPGLPTPTAATVTPAKTPVQRPAPQPRPPQASGARQTTNVQLQTTIQPPPLELMLVAFLLLTLVGAWHVLRQRVGPIQRKKFGLLDWLLPLALAVNLLVLLGLALGGGGGSTGPPNAAPPLQKPETGLQNRLSNLSHLLRVPMDLLSVLLWVVFGLTLLALAVAVYLLLRRTAGPAAPLAGTGQEGPPDAASATPALHRIRLAYLAAETALRDAGRGRTPAETPTTYAARLGHDHPELLPALPTLTRLYAPVRYGMQADDADDSNADHADAERAEAASRDLCELAKQLPPLPTEKEDA